MLAWSRGVGSKKKRENVTEESQRQTSPPQARRSRATANRQISGEASLEAYMATLDGYFDKIEEFSETPEFQEMFTLEAIEKIINQYPGIRDAPEVTALLDSDDFKDPVKFQAVAKQGIRMLRVKAREFAGILTDPAALKQLIDDVIPDEYKPIVDQALRGDLSGLKAALSTVPGVTQDQLNLFDGLTSGNTNAIRNVVNNALGDNTNIEELRQFYLQNREMATALGISQEVINDQTKWLKFIHQMLADEENAPASGNDQEEIITEFDSTSRILEKLRAI